MYKQVTLWISSQDRQGRELQSIYYKKYCLKYLSQSQEVCNGLVQTEEAGGHLSPSSILDV